MSLSFVKDSDIQCPPSGQYSIDKALARNTLPDCPTSYIRSVVDLVLLVLVTIPAKQSCTDISSPIMSRDIGRNQPDIDNAFVLRPVYFCDKENWKNFFQTHQDSNLKKQNQNLLCCQLHYRSSTPISSMIFYH